MKVTVTHTKKGKTETTVFDHRRVMTNRIYKPIWDLITDASGPITINSIVYDNDSDIDDRIANLVGAYIPDFEDGYPEKIK